MTQQPVTESPEKTQQHVERSQIDPTAAEAFESGLHPFLRMQRTLGNRGVARLIQAKRLTPGLTFIGLQRRVTVNAADDQYEEETDQVAEAEPARSASMGGLEPGHRTRRHRRRDRRGDRRRWQRDLGRGVGTRRCRQERRRRGRKVRCRPAQPHAATSPARAEDQSPFRRRPQDQRAAELW
jgi:hypothetical protein